MQVLEEVSALTGQGKGTLVSELVVEALPMLRASIDALRLVKESPREAQALLARVSNEAVMRLSQAQLEFDDLMAKQPRPKRQKRRRGSSDGTT